MSVERWFGNWTPRQISTARDGYLGAIAEKSEEIARRGIWRGCNAQRFSILAPTVINAIRDADLVLWDNPIWHAAGRGWQSFSEHPIEDSDLPPAPMLWFTDSGWIPDGEELDALEIDHECELQSILITKAFGVKSDAGTLDSVGRGLIPHDKFTGRVGLLQVRFYMPETGDAIPFIRALPTRWIDQPADPSTNWIVACHHFMKEPFVTVERVSSAVSRAERRHAERKGKLLPLVSIIRLRRKENTGGCDPSHQAVDWSCRWLVRGHWRRQFHPSTGERKPKYIAPHLKGPDDMPFRPPAERTYLVNR